MLLQVEGCDLTIERRDVGDGEINLIHRGQTDRWLVVRRSLTVTDSQVSQGKSGFYLIDKNRCFSKFTSIEFKNRCLRKYRKPL